ncbi:hypothetical protein K1719_007792 [Acacia pycnantha]|nr:hypothetical protein K1719_007792 [Acacia pycnantha]
MDSSVQQRTPTKRNDKFKKTPVKVVYISNPMKVEVSPSGFMALVQELTGQDAEWPTDLSRFQNPDIIDGEHQTSDSENSSVTKSTGSHESDHTLMMPQVDPNFNNFEGQLGSSMEEGFDPFDQTIGDISAVITKIAHCSGVLILCQPKPNLRESVKKGEKGKITRGSKEVQLLALLVANEDGFGGRVRVLEGEVRLGSNLPVRFVELNDFDPVWELLQQAGFGQAVLLVATNAPVHGVDVPWHVVGVVDSKEKRYFFSNRKDHIDNKRLAGSRYWKTVDRCHSPVLMATIYGGGGL